MADFHDDLGRADWLHEEWARRAWSSWEPLFSEKLLHVSSTAGFYRIRAAGTEDLAYIGETGLNLRSRLQALRRNAQQQLMPFNDPHTAAPGFWAYRAGSEISFEVSTSPFQGETRERKAIECQLLWLYRLQRGESTWLNHGRFHPQHTKSRNRASGERGRPLNGTPNPAAGPCSKPLAPHGTPTSLEWCKLDWTPWLPLTDEPAPARPGLYRIRAGEEEQLDYIGQSQYLRNRLSSHARKADPARCLVVSYVVLTTGYKHQLLELENDLIGAYYDLLKTPPRRQFGSDTPPTNN